MLSFRNPILWLGLCCASPALAQTGDAGMLPALSQETRECINCHKSSDPGILQQWGQSQHFRGNVGCFECHAAKEGEADAYEHFGHTIAIIVSPQYCSKCHSKEAAEFAGSHQSKVGRILGSLDNRLAEVVEGIVVL